MKLARAPQDLVAGLLFMLVGIIGILESSSYRLGTLLQMGPGYFPLLVFSLLTFLGALVAGRGMLVYGPRIEPARIRPILVITLSLLAFWILVVPAGFVIAGLALMFVSFHAEPQLSAGRRIGLALVMVAFSALLFVYALGLPFELWPSFHE